ncbi:gol [Symbiodinium microadriaticum]|nr:gol [Symbiodinium microadriaticum]
MNGLDKLKPLPSRKSSGCCECSLPFHFGVLRGLEELGLHSCRCRRLKSFRLVVGWRSFAGYLFWVGQGPPERSGSHGGMAGRSQVAAVARTISAVRTAFAWRHSSTGTHGRRTPSEADAKKRPRRRRGEALRFDLARPYTRQEKAEVRDEIAEALSTLPERPPKDVQESIDPAELRLKSKVALLCDLRPDAGPVEVAQVLRRTRDCYEAAEREAKEECGRGISLQFRRWAAQESGLAAVLRRTLQLRRMLAPQALADGACLALALLPATDSNAAEALLEALAPHAVSDMSASSFTRSASALLGGGVSAGPPSLSRPRENSGAAEETLLSRVSSRRQVDSQSVQRRLRDEAVEQLMQRFTPKIICLCFVGLFGIAVASFALVIVFWRAFFAALAYGSLPCDQPMLRYYMVFSILIGRISEQLSAKASRYMQVRGMSTRSVWVSTTLTSLIPGWITMTWGYTLIQGSSTCRTTNPHLFFDTRTYVYFQIAASLAYLLLGIPLILFAHRFLLAIRSLNSGEGVRGCAAMIKDLPKIPSDSPELQDPEDGSIMECSICLVSFSSLTVVRTPCKHYFCEPCLTKWCKAHVTCPLCKSLVADPGPLSADSSEVAVRRDLPPVLGAANAVGGLPGASGLLCALLAELAEMGPMLQEQELFEVLDVLGSHVGEVGPAIVEDFVESLRYVWPLCGSRTLIKALLALGQVM